MKTLLTLVLTIVGTVAVLLASPAVASAESGSDRDVPTAVMVMDQGAPAVAQAGTPMEAREYEAREAASPEVQEFAGGDVVIGVSLVAIALIVLIVILLSD